jgi:Dolichyl-phosphate-mannose-protein mannosyltransferase
MTTAEGRGVAEGPGRRRVWAALALVLAAAFALRLWGIRSGLPYAYNADENSHFVPRAIGMFTFGWNPHYFANPPAYTDLLRIVFAVWFGGRAGVSHAFAADPSAVFTAARVCAAVLGAAAVWLLYIAGARLFGRAVALLAAAVEAAAFLPVFYSHLALNDVPTLAPLTLSLVGSSGVLRKGRARDWLLAGVGLGLGCATKYTAGIALLPLLAAAGSRYLAPAVGRPSVRPVAVGLALAGAAALASFLLADPYSLLDFHAFTQGIAHQSSLSGESGGKLGAPHGGGIGYYLWSLSWGLGWAPAVAALGGALFVWRRERRLGWMLVPAPVLYLVLMGSESRFFGRWLLPIFPILCLLAAFFALRFASALAVWTHRSLKRRTPAEPFPSAFSPSPAPRLRVVLVAAVSIALCGQGVVWSVHSDLVLSRADTRNTTRAWLAAHVPAGTGIVVEPVVPDEWVSDVGRPIATTPEGARWAKYRSLQSVVDAAGELRPLEPHEVSLENYERTLAPALIPYYESLGFCWVVTGSAESGRAFADPSAVPEAVAYYRALAREGEVVYRISPYRQGARPVAFNFDWSFDFYPLAYVRPGPEMTVYRLHGGRCAPRR